MRSSIDDSSIFISYAREDERKASAIYDHLLTAGFSPWMDSRNIFAGEDWQQAIAKAIQHASVFLACFSRASITKRGFLRRELRLALDAMQERLDDIYLLPVRFEPVRYREHSPSISG